MTLHSIVGNRTNGGRPLFSIITVLCLMIMYAPALYLLLASLNPDEQLGLVAPTRYSLTWYVALLDDHRLFRALEESAIVALATAALATPIGLAAALGYRVMTRMRSIFVLVILSTMLVPGTIEGLGLSTILRLVRVSPSWVTVTLGHLLWTLPFAIIVSLIGLSAVRPSTIAAARDLGAGPMRAFVDVTLPLIRGNLVSSFVFAFLLSLNEYARAYYLVGRQNTVPLYMFGAMNSGASPTIYAFSGAVLIVSFAAVALIFVGAARRQSLSRVIARLRARSA
ncbi:MAG: spermidine/putrescine transport system permease protein [Bradyrhizobium sp.]|jgi:ABC-type spermidine/putrescine transport system permease subunit II|nr:spermidine/putrescine transport system permease protein [Bradyrhizobium sp.]